MVVGYLVSLTLLYMLLLVFCSSVLLKLVLVLLFSLASFPLLLSFCSPVVFLQLPLMFYIHFLLLSVLLDIHLLFRTL